MPDVMMSFGDFKFSVDGAAYNEFRRKTEYEWAAQKRIGNTENLQFTGYGPEVVSLAGFFYTLITGRYGIMDDLRALAAKRKPQLLVAGTGDVFGQFVIESIEDSASTFYSKGVARKVEFTVELRKYGVAK